MGLSPLSLDQQRYKRILVLQHDSLGNRIRWQSPCTWRGSPIVFAQNLG
jgi:hypothetical protein